MGEMNILCSADIDPQDIAVLKDYALSHGITLEEAIRKAVSFFAGRCVPTQAARAVAV